MIEVRVGWEKWPKLDRFSSGDRQGTLDHDHLPPGGVASMPLSDSQIRAALRSGSLVIEPFDDRALAPSSYDIRISDQITVTTDHDVIDLGSDEDIGKRQELRKLGPEGLLLEPGKMVYGSAVEFIDFKSHCGFVVTRSSLARIGLLCSVSAYANPGYRGNLPLVISNLGTNPVRLVPGRRVAQVLFFPVEGVERMYSDRGGKYLDERGPTPSRQHLDVELRDLLVGVGVPERQLARTMEYLEKRIEEVAEKKAQEKANELGKKP